MDLGYFRDFNSHPHVVLLAGDSGEFIFLCSRMAELTDNNSLAIHEFEGVKPTCGETLNIRISQRDRITRSDSSSFEWEMTREMLEESLDKMDTLTSGVQPCHQYFDCHPSDDAIIMMPVGEYDESWWDRVFEQRSSF